MSKEVSAVTQAEDAWRRKSDEQVQEAMGVLEQYTEEGRSVIRAEYARRRLDEPAEAQPKCPKCGIRVALRDDFDKCATCGEQFSDEFQLRLQAWAGVDGADQDEPVAADRSDEEQTELSETATAVTQTEDAGRGHNVVVNRYLDAYHEAKVLVAIGGIIKFVGIVAAVLIVLVMASTGAKAIGDGAIVGGFLIGVLVGGAIYIAGISVSSRGQILRATLDTAVYSSTFMNESEKAQAMGLPKKYRKRK